MLLKYKCIEQRNVEKIVACTYNKYVFFQMPNHLHLLSRISIIGIVVIWVVPFLIIM